MNTFVRVLLWCSTAYIAFFSFVWPYVPVVVFMEAKGWQIEDGKLMAYVTGRKIKDCQFVAHSESGYVKRNGTWERSVFNYGDSDRLPGTTRPTGPQSFGVWIWTPVGTGDFPTETMVRVEHLCGSSTVSTISGPFEVPQSLKPD